MNNATQVLAAFREMTANKSISRDELHDLIKDGILAALAKRYGPNVEAEIEIDEDTGSIDITVLKEVVAEVEDSSRADLAGGGALGRPGLRGRRHDRGPGRVRRVRPQRGDGRQAAHPAARPRGRAAEDPRRVRATAWASCSRGEVQQVERGKIVVMLNRTPRRRRHHPVEGAEPARAVPPGRGDPRRAEEGGGDAQGAAPDPVPRRPALRGRALQARGAGDPAGDRRDQGRRARGRRPHQAGGVARATSRSIRWAPASG